MPEVVPSILTPLALSPKDAAALLSISRRQLDILISAGRLRARKVGTRTLIDYANLNAFYQALPAKVEGSIPNAPQCSRSRRRRRRAQPSGGVRT